MGLLRTGASRSIEEGVGNQERLPGGGAPHPKLTFCPLASRALCDDTGAPAAPVC